MGIRSQILLLAHGLGLGLGLAATGPHHASAAPAISDCVAALRGWNQPIENFDLYDGQGPRSFWQKPGKGPRTLVSPKKLLRHRDLPTLFSGHFDQALGLKEFSPIPEFGTLHYWFSFPTPVDNVFLNQVPGDYRTELIRFFNAGRFILLVKTESENAFEITNPFFRHALNSMFQMNIQSPYWTPKVAFLLHGLPSSAGSVFRSSDILGTFYVWRKDRDITKEFGLPPGEVKISPRITFVTDSKAVAQKVYDFFLHDLDQNFPLPVHSFATWVPPRTAPYTDDLSSLDTSDARKAAEESGLIMDAAFQETTIDTLRMMNPDLFAQHPEKATHQLDFTFGGEWSYLVFEYLVQRLQEKPFTVSFASQY